MAFLYRSSYDTPGLAPNINVLLWGDFSVCYSNRDTSWNLWNRHWGSLMVDTVILFRKMKSPSHKWQMAFWPSTSYTDVHTNQTFHLVTEIDLHRMMSGIHGAFATDMACRQGMVTLPDTLTHPFWDFLMIKLLRPVFPKLPCLLSTFHLNIPWYFLDVASNNCSFKMVCTSGLKCSYSLLLISITFSWSLR